MKNIDPSRIKDIVHIEIGHYKDNPRNINKEIVQLNEYIQKGYVPWGKPLKMWDNSRQKHYTVYCLALLEEEKDNDTWLKDMGVLG